ncbi:zinc finger B-box domain-containing protein 1, partial [Orycteropus afer afer]|uniref:Zinc finger B-box domain-containing protein 1 n=1 Tax=Orycteropus afer afer TaxID=1230840 RepID=A0A8B7AG35_ORYAF
AKSQILSSVLDVAHQFIREVNPGEPKEENNSTKEISENHSKSKSSPLQESSSEVVFTTSKKTESANQKDGLLCEGSFNEEASARSFQEVLQQWRTGNHNANEKQNLHATKPDSMEACEVQTNLKIWREPLEIQFKEDSLSYMDKLWLKKHKRNLQGQLLNMQQDKFIHSSKTTSDTQLSPNGSDEESNVEETKVQHPALFLKAEELKIERFEPALKIVELDDTYEEEFEERGNVVPYKVELADADSKQSWTFHEYQKNNFLYENDVHRHYVFAKRRTGLLNICVTNSSSCYKENSTAGISNMDFDNMADLHVYSTATEKVEEKSFCEKNLTEESIANHKSADSSTPFESKDSLPSVDLEEPSVKEKLYQGIRGSLDFSNLHERPNLQDSKTTQSPLLLQEIALRRKPITEHYQGLEKFFFSDENRRLNLLPSHSLEGSSSSTKITLAGDREWIPDHSLSAHADNAVALDVLCGAQNLSPSRKQQTVGKTSQRPSTANLPFSNSVKKSSSCLSSSHLRPRSVTTRLLSRAAFEISEIEYIDVTNHNEPFLDNIADQQTLDSLEKELNELRNLADPSEKLYSLTSEELPAFNSHLQNMSDTTVDFLKTSNSRGPCGFQQQSSSGKDTEIPFWLTPSESTTDEDEEDFMDKQHVITLPWSNNI